MDWYWPEGVDLPGYKPNEGAPEADQGRGAAHGRGERPVIYAGGGILKARAAEALRELAELINPGGDHADGARARSPTTTSCASGCRECTATTPR